MPIMDLAGFEPFLLFTRGKRQVRCGAVSEVHAFVPGVTGNTVAREYCRNGKIP